MNWRPLTETDLLSSLNAVEVAGYTQAALTKGNEPVEEILTNVSHEARGYIAGCKENILLPEGATLPPEVIAHALAIARHRLLAFAGITVDDARKLEFEEAGKFFLAVSKGHVRVTPEFATSPEATSNTAGPSPLFQPVPPRRLD